MKRIVFATMTVLLMGTAAFAGGSGNHSHGHDEMMNAGKPGEHSKVTRTVEVLMMEKDDGSMVFEPATLNFKKDETVRLVLINKGDWAVEAKKN